MKQKRLFMSLLALSLAVGACDLFRDNDDGFLNEAGPILFLSNEGGKGTVLYSMYPDDSRITQLTKSRSRFSISHAVWSPDGERILMREVGPPPERQPGDNGIFFSPSILHVVDKDGKRINTCSFDDLDMFADPVWSPDSRMFVYGSGRTPRRNMLVDAQTCDKNQFGEIQFSSREQYAQQGTFISDWSSDGLTLLGTTDYSTYDSVTDVFTRAC